MFCDVSVPVAVPGTLRMSIVPDKAPVGSRFTLKKHWVTMSLTVIGKFPYKHRGE